VIDEGGKMDFFLIYINKKLKLYFGDCVVVLNVKFFEYVGSTILNKKYTIACVL
jgi:hypothetical protein